MQSMSPPPKRQVGGSNPPVPTTYLKISARGMAIAPLQQFPRYARNEKIG